MNSNIAKKWRTCAPVTRYLCSCVVLLVVLRRHYNTAEPPNYHLVHLLHPPKFNLAQSIAPLSAAAAASTHMLIRQKSISYARSSVTITTTRRSIRFGKRTIGPRENTAYTVNWSPIRRQAMCIFIKMIRKKIQILIGKN